MDLDENFFKTWTLEELNKELESIIKSIDERRANSDNIYSQKSSSFVSSPPVSRGMKKMPKVVLKETPFERRYSLRFL